MSFSVSIQEEVRALTNLLESYYKKEIPSEKLKKIIWKMRETIKDRFEQVEQVLIRRYQLEFLSTLLN